MLPYLLSVPITSCSYPHIFVFIATKKSQLWCAYLIQEILFSFSHVILGTVLSVPLSTFSRAHSRNSGLISLLLPPLLFTFTLGHFVRSRPPISLGLISLSFQRSFFIFSSNSVKSLSQDFGKIPDIPDFF